MIFHVFGGFWWCSGSCVDRELRGRLPGPPRVLRVRFSLEWKSKNSIFMKILAQLRARKGKYGPNLTTKISKSEILDFSKLAPERSWSNAGMVGHSETCFKHTVARPRLALRFLTCMTLSRQSTGMTRNFSIRRTSNSSKSRIPKIT